MIELESSIPTIMGTLRARVSVLPRRTIKSETNPPTSTPTKAPRKGSADNALTKMVKERTLKREKVEGGRGSTYSLA